MSALRQLLSKTAPSNAKLLQCSSPIARSRRTLMLDEHAGMSVLQEDGILVPKYGVARTASQAYDIAKGIPGKDVVVKAQVLAGGRGKGSFDSGLVGGVHIAYNAEEARDLAEKMIGHKLSTIQTGAKGIPCSAVMVAERMFNRREYYFSILMDREHNGPVMIGSGRGGMSIEDVARDEPDAIHKCAIDVEHGIQRQDALEMARSMGFQGENIKAAAETMTSLYDVFMRNDATLLEINPMTESTDGHVYCMDCKLVIDDNASYRQRHFFADRDLSNEDPMELAAQKADLNYIRLDGDIGCLATVAVSVNGAGLAMSTMDIIQLHGGSPANFLDVGGGATADQVTEAFRIITSDDKVRAILVNIFGGIMRCDVIAQGIVQAASKLNLRIPVVVRLQGTKVDEAKDVLNSSTLKVMPCNDLDDAAQMAVNMANIVNLAKKADVHVNFELPM